MKARAQFDSTFDAGLRTSGGEAGYPQLSLAISHHK